MDASGELPLVLDALSGMHAKLYRAFSGLRLAGKTKEQRVFLLSYSSFYSSFSACLALLRAGQFSFVPLSLRTILEVFSDIINIPRIEGYADRLLYTINAERLKFLRNIIGMSGNDEILNRELLELCAEVEKQKSMHIKILSKKDKLVIAGLENYYYTLYGYWSGYVHNDFNITLGVSINVDERFLDLFYRRKVNSKMTFVFIQFLFEAMMKSAFAVVEYIGGHNEDVFSSFCSDSEELKTYLDQLKASGLG